MARERLSSHKGGRVVADLEKNERMTAKPKRDERGRFMPKWAAELRYTANLHSDRLNNIDGGLSDPRDRPGTSTPLIIWNIAVLIAIAYLYCKAYVPGTP